MKAFMSAKNGFELAEYDLALRGAGELAGGKQWGVSDIAMEALKISNSSRLLVLKPPRSSPAIPN